MQLCIIKHWFLLTIISIYFFLIKDIRRELLCIMIKYVWRNLIILRRTSDLIFIFIQENISMNYKKSRFPLFNCNIERIAIISRYAGLLKKKKIWKISFYKDIRYYKTFGKSKLVKLYNQLHSVEMLRLWQEINLDPNFLQRYILTSTTKPWKRNFHLMKKGNYILNWNKYLIAYMHWSHTFPFYQFYIP